MKRKTRGGWVLAGLALVGLLDSIYLTYESVTQGGVTCSLDAGGNILARFADCDVVTTSVYSHLLGFPVAFFGILFYLSMLYLAILFMRDGARGTLTLLAVLSGVGFLGTLYFLYLQAFVLNAYCLYCLISAATSTLLLVVSGVLWLKERSKQRVFANDDTIK